MSRLTILFLLHCLGCAALAVELVSGPRITLEPGRAVLRWTTDTPCGGRVSHGTSPGRLDQKATGPVTAEHEVVLSGLPEAGTVYYELGSARRRLAEGSFVIGQAAAAPEPAAETVPKPLLERVLDALRPGQAAPKAATPAPAAPPAARAPPTRATWGRMDTLQDHFDRHGADFRSTSPDDYAAQAWQFLQRARNTGLPMKWDDADGTLRVYDPATRAFAAYNRDGRTKTYFRPDSPTYWQRQPGRLVRPDQLPFR